MTEPIQPPTAAVTTEKLTRCFGTQCAVDNVDLRVEAGTFYGFLGPNGAGKSTTIKMLTGLLQPSSGSIRVLGKNPLDPSEAIEIKRQIGVVPDNLALFEYLTAVDYLTFIGRVASSMIRGLLQGFVERGGTVFLTSHILEIVERLCTHVGIIAGGKLVEQTSLAEMRAGGTLEGRFLEKLGFQPESTARLNWLEATTRP